MKILILNLLWLGCVLFASGAHVKCSGNPAQRLVPFPLGPDGEKYSEEWWHYRKRLCGDDYIVFKDSICSPQPPDPPVSRLHGHLTDDADTISTMLLQRYATTG
ncbi:unnamed protein product, partial [Mesorhabditis spiculigera]